MKIIFKDLQNYERKIKISPSQKQKFEFHVF